MKWNTDREPLKYIKLIPQSLLCTLNVEMVPRRLNYEDSLLTKFLLKIQTHLSAHLSSFNGRNYSRAGSELPFVLLRIIQHPK